MNGKTWKRIELIATLGITIGGLAAAAYYGKRDLNKEMRSLTNAKLISEDPIIVVYDSDNDGDPDTSRNYMRGPLGGVFPFDDRPSSREEVNLYKSKPF